MSAPLLFLLLLLGCLNLGFTYPPAVVDAREDELPIYASQVPAIVRLQPPPVTAEHYAVIDGETGALIAGRGADARIAPASTTKIATAIVALERGRLDDMVRIDVDRAELGDSSLMGLVLGDRVSLRDLLYGLLLPSGNDAAIAIARHIAGDEARFAALMNAKAAELGLKNTHFVNPHGLDDPDHYSSARDLAMLGRYAMQLPEFATIVGQREHTAQGANNVYRMVNTNHLLGRYPGVDGVKTGFTENARQALVASATREGRRVFTAVVRSEDRLADTPPLLDYYFDNFETRSIALPASAVFSLPLSEGKPLGLAPRPVPRVVLPSWQWPYVRAAVWLDAASINGQRDESRVGLAGYYLGRKLLAEAPVYAR